MQHSAMMKLILQRSILGEYSLNLPDVLMKIVQQDLPFCSDKISSDPYNLV